MTQASTQTAMATTQTAKAATIPQANMSERFMNKVLQEFSGSVGEFQITDYQRQLIQGRAPAPHVRPAEGPRAHTEPCLSAPPPQTATWPSRST